MFILSSNKPYQFSRNELKAVYLEKITRFVKWPTYNNKDWGTKTFYIGVMADDEFYITAKNLLQIKNPSFKRTIKIVKIEQEKDIEEKKLHALYIGNVSKKDLDLIVDDRQCKDLLIITDGRTTAKTGTMVNFYVKNSKLKFEINVPAFSCSKISPSIHLLNYAKLINNH